MTVTSKAVLWLTVASLVLSALACSALTGGSGGSGGGADSGRTLADSLPEETHPGDYIAYMGYYFAVLQVKDPGALSGKGMALELVIGNQSGAMHSPFSFSFGGISGGGDRVFGAARGRQSGRGPGNLFRLAVRRARGPGGCPDREHGRRPADVPVNHDSGRRRIRLSPRRFGSDDDAGEKFPRRRGILRGQSVFRRSVVVRAGFGPADLQSGIGPDGEPDPPLGAFLKPRPPAVREKKPPPDPSGGGSPKEEEVSFTRRANIIGLIRSAVIAECHMSGGMLVV
jgi:hypothetical protein